jgi:hypothetical protein
MDLFNVDDFYISLTIDYGTTKLRVTGQVVPNRHEPDQDAVHCLWLQGTGPEVDQVISFHPANPLKTFRWGSDIVQQMSSGNIPPRTIIRHGMKTWQFAPPEVLAEINSLVQDTFGRHRRGRTDYRTLLTIHLEQIKEACLRCIPDIYPETAPAVATMTLRTRLGTTEISDPGKMRWMQLILEEAGFGDVKPFSESEAARCMACPPAASEEQGWEIYGRPEGEYI